MPLIKTITVGFDKLNLFKEDNPSPSDHKMFAEVVGMKGCIITGDTEEDIIRDASDVIEMYRETMAGHIKEVIQ